MVQVNKRNIRIEHGSQAFFTDSIALFHNNSKFIMDFRQSTPRIDQIDDRAHETMVVSHNAIIMDPVTTKMFYTLLAENISNYEKKFGEIKLPEQKKEEIKKKGKKDDFSYIG